MPDSGNPPQLELIHTAVLVIQIKLCGNLLISFSFQGAAPVLQATLAHLQVQAIQQNLKVCGA
jgi:hypothetical protein